SHAHARAASASSIARTIAASEVAAAMGVPAHCGDSSPRSAVSSADVTRSVLLPVVEEHSLRLALHVHVEDEVTALVATGDERARPLAERRQERVIRCAAGRLGQVDARVEAIEEAAGEHDEREEGKRAVP